MIVDVDKQPVIVITDKEGYLLQVGIPENFTGVALTKYIQKGCWINTMTNGDFKAKNYTWIWDKPKS